MTARVALGTGIVLAVAATAAPGAAAQIGSQPPSSTQPAPTQPQPAPPPRPAKGRMSLKVRGGMSTRRLRYAVKGQRILVTGTVKPYVAGQTVVVEVRRRRKVLTRKRVSIRRGRRGRGRFVTRLKLRRFGVLRIVARHDATAQQVAFQDRGPRVKVGRWQAGKGSRGTKVRLLQRGLRSLGYATPVSGYYGGGTARAVLAFRKVNNMGRSGRARASVFRKVFRHRGRFRLRHPRAGKHVEFDWSRQVLVLAVRGRAWRTYHASSGTAATPTVLGGYRFYRKQPGTNARGMLHSNYFIRGYAIHGYPSVPNYPASHGCIRIPNPNARAVNRWIRLGDRIFVYR